MLKIYVCHASNFDYSTELYLPLKKSILWTQHIFILPHEINKEPLSSKSIIEDCDLILAEVSYPSTGLGIELGWTHAAQRPLFCIYKAGSFPSASLMHLHSDLIEYANSEDMIQKISATINYISNGFQDAARHVCKKAAD